ncbi:MAG: hypothetical protein V4615_01800 [Bacteroidota bacterium]
MNAMKYIILSLVFTVINLSAQAGNPVWETKIKAPRANTLNKIPANFSVPVAEEKKGFDKCKVYRNKQVAGFVLLPVSLGMMAGGTYLIYTGAKNIVNRTNIGFSGVSTEVSKEDKLMIGVGAGLGFVGAVLFPTSLILGIKGGTNYNRDCRGGSGTGSTLHIRPTGNGINMALKF